MFTGSSGPGPGGIAVSLFMTALQALVQIQRLDLCVCMSSNLLQHSCSSLIDFTSAVIDSSLI